MSLFPVIYNNGGRAPYPNPVTFEHLTNVSNLPCNAHIAFGWRVEPLARYVLNFKNLTDAEASVVETFFNSQNGRFGQFAYIDPTGNLLQDSEDFPQASWTKACTVGASLADPAGGTAGMLLTADGSGNSSITQTVTLDPAVAGSLACFSVYLMAGFSGALNVYLTDGAATTTKACLLTFGTWTRVSIPWTFGTSGVVTVGVGGSSSWTGTTVIAIFGPMLSMTAGAAPYLRTPGFAALRDYCRFDQDVLDLTYRGPNQNDVTVRINEFSPAVPSYGLIATIIDMSGSIADTHSLPDEQAAAIAFVGALNLKWSVGLWTFSGTLTMNLNYTLDRAAFTTAVGALGLPVGGTPLYDSIVTICATRPTAILLLTDGVDGSTVHTQADAIAACNNAGVAVYALGFGTADAAALAALTSATGGSYVIAPTSAQLRALALAVVAQL